MFTILSLLVLGMSIGCLVRRFHHTVDTSHTAFITIAVLIFIFGATIGSKQVILDNLGSIGFPALLISVLGISGSLIAAYFYNHIFGKKGGDK